MLNRILSVSMVTATIVAAAALYGAPEKASAFGMGTSPTCGTLCMASFRPTFGPYMGLPMFPVSPGYYPYQTGQMHPAIMAQYSSLYWSQQMGTPFYPMPGPMPMFPMSGRAF
jgi:hypothetical protein